ncbi:hypothetical protein NVP1121O_056 [Vibrio phage 1.121.O._10N.286.46.C4]|nr:hypothetical protein NVP1121O_056 [Vibrio phage 1.121.O._10N.286.46.C4]
MNDLPWVENWEPSYKISVGTREMDISLYTQQELQAIPTALQRPSLAEASQTIPSNAVFISNLVSEGFDREGHDFTFNSINSLSQQGSDTETSTFVLHNPSKEFVDILTQESSVLILEVGYQQKVVQIYSGDIISVKSNAQGVGSSVTVKCASGALSMRNTLVNLNYDESVSEKDVILDMVRRFPATAVGTYGLEDLKDRYRTGGRTFVGSLVSNFDKVMAKHNLNYAYSEGKIHITPFRIRGEDYDAFARTNFILPLKSIKKIDDISERQGVGATDTATKLRKLQINTFFLPIELGQFITVPDGEYTKDYAGTYQVQARRLILNTKGAWDTVVHCIEV